MNNVATFSSSELRELFSETAAIKGVSTSIAEKDFWVTWILGKIFASEDLGPKFISNGGTNKAGVAFYSLEVRLINLL